MESAKVAFPGANGKIAFDSDRDGDDEIYTMNPDDTAVKRLIRNPAWDSLPAWSPNGNYIAFKSDRNRGIGGGAQFEINRMSASGGSQVRLTNCVAYEWRPDWKPLP